MSGHQDSSERLHTLVYTCAALSSGFVLGVLFQMFFAGPFVRAVFGADAGSSREHRSFPVPLAGLPDEIRGTLSLFILAGQSNMSGRGEVPDAQEAHPRTYTFGNDYRWRLAREPVDSADEQVDQVSEDSGRDPAGFGPALSFARALAEHRPQMAIGLIPCAKGDTTIAQWQRSLADTTLYGSCLKRVRAASLEGVVAGILFFQGEADALDPARNLERDLAAGSWGARFSSVIDDMRTDLGDPRLPVVFAQIGTNAAPKAFVHWAVIREQQTTVARPCTAMIATDDLPLRDAVHFTTESYRTIGRRFADAYLRLTANPECR